MITHNKFFCLIFATVLIFSSLFIVTSVAYADTNSNTTTEQSDAEGCKYSALQKQYMDGSTCWYCMVVGKMTGAYLYAASLVIPTVQTLALLLLRFGFLIWLALYILKQVSSLSPTSVGKFLQEIFIMGFKVLLAMLIVKDGTTFLNTYIMTPVIDTGIDIGNAIFNQIALDPAFNIEGGS